MNVRVLTWNKPRAPKEEELKAMMEKEGMKLYMLAMDRDEFMKTHSHDQDEIRILVSGQVEFSAEGRSHVLKPGDRIDLKKGTPYTAKNLETGQSVMLCSSKGEHVYVEKY